jgi:hypothetical protein
VYRYVTADTVAETMEGVSRETYKELWNNIVPLQTSDYDEHGEHKYETPGDTLSSGNQLVNFWDRLSPEAQANLRDVAQREEDEGY